MYLVKWVDQQTWYIESRAIVCFRLLCMFRRCDWFVANQQHKKLSNIQVTGHVTFGKVDEDSTYYAGDDLSFARISTRGPA